MTHRLLVFGLMASLTTAVFAQTSYFSSHLYATMTPHLPGATNRAAANGAASAGNAGRDSSENAGGYHTIMAAGSHPCVVTAGAMNPMGTPQRGEDRIASYSSRGPTLLDQVVKPDLAAPGNGSSMATPGVSGAAALLVQETPSRTPDRLKARLMKTAGKNFPARRVATDPATGQTYTSDYDIFTVGADYPDILAALNNYGASQSALCGTGHRRSLGRRRFACEQRLLAESGEQL